MTRGATRPTATPEATQAATQAATSADDRQDNAKRQQILDGARRVFRANGFDGTSMDAVAREAGVSKGTLYVYFDSKEALFKALILKDRFDQPESCLQIPATIGDLEHDLKTIAGLYLARMMQPDMISMLRMVIGATEKFPKFGPLLYEEGPLRGRENLKDFLRPHIAAGALEIEDEDVAAWHFLDLCIAGTLRRMLLNVGDAPTDAERTATVNAAVRVFLKAYGRS
ncbi:TetR/AcrR family transcriptional regulator [Pannonibacter sp. SL95]|uniref:TetR/AcrR family transcriptional regulator n=1 Tax=Pannonibacter sp. SL95 TaxID=2995153 RepID=UPI002276CADC|nr:TetR/AcrR family transcriptional regulator [Pannonibacter sp. SL95]MCY1707415.1 TetR/AcrR family transcriptional regulator [Pannonibacter sp. SL95]